ncbi:MAG: hypothetical protein KBC94_22735 [Pseudacidovorax sp.]|uniref:hypothetical protein n=1 Tax=Pseudacidovorax sp. TaxID=1934311 RepID=UPI001B6A52A3|nr:hypothetical protein [Pseudacidovorax sp.]MBP6897244.1 hypothetical protein [Pseudacidovorax sp.]
MNAPLPVDSRSLAAQLEAGAQELALAGAMLAQAMGDLRAGFVQVAGAQTDSDVAVRTALRQVMVALQAEDTLGQLLQAAQRRQSQLAGALRHAAADTASTGAARRLPAWPPAAAWGDAHGTACPTPGAPGAGTHEFF